MRLFFVLLFFLFVCFLLLVVVMVFLCTELTTCFTEKALSARSGKLYLITGYYFWEEACQARSQ